MVTEPQSQRGLRRVLVACGIALALVLAYLLRSVLVPLFIAFLVAYALDPIVEKLASWRVPRSLAAPLVMVGVLAIFVTIAFFAIPFVIDQFGDAASELPSKLQTLHDAAESWLWSRFHVHMPATWTELVNKYGPSVRESLPDANRVIEALFGTVNAILFLLSMLIVPVFSLYLLIDFDRIVTRTEALLPRRWAPDAHKLALEIHLTLGRYVRGQIVTNLILATLYATGLTLVGVRLGAVIGVMTGFLAFVPYVGLAIGMCLALIMALLDFHSATQLVAVIAVMGGVGFLDGMLITPRIVGGSVGLKPIEVLLTMMAAATLFGFLGVLLAVPLGAVLKILVGHGVDAYLGSTFYRKPPSLAGEPVADVAPDSAEPSLPPN